MSVISCEVEAGGREFQDSWGYIEFRAKTSYIMRLTFKQRNKIIKFKNNIALFFKDWCYYINILKEMSHSYDVIQQT